MPCDAHLLAFLPFCFFYFIFPALRLPSHVQLSVDLSTGRGGIVLPTILSFFSFFVCCFVD